MKIGLTSIFVNDPIPARAFYTGVLGFTDRVFMPEANLSIVAAPDDPGGTGLLLEPSDNPIGKSYQTALYKAGLPAIVLSVDDLQSEYERLKERGVVFKSPPTQEDWGLTAIFDDTCGNYIQLHQA